MKKIGLFLGLFAVLIFLPLMSISHAELWDLIIHTDFEKNRIFLGEAPIINGIIVDHASKPVSDVQVHIRSGGESIFTITDNEGMFSVELNDKKTVPGTYVVSVVASAPDGKTGLASVQFNVRGELTPTKILQEKLATDEARKYLSSSIDDFEKDPIGLTLFNYYHEIHQQLIKTIKASQEFNAEEIFINKQKAIADKLREQQIEELKPGPGVFQGFQYDIFVDNLDLSIKDTIVNQLNFTKNIFHEAQLIRDEIILNGGTQAEAHQAYLEKMAITKQQLENFGIDTFEEIVEDAIIEDAIIEEPIVESQEIAQETEIHQIEIDGINIKISLDGKTIFLNVNGTIVEFFVNETEIILIDKSEN